MLLNDYNLDNHVIYVWKITLPLTFIFIFVYYILFKDPVAGSCRTKSSLVDTEWERKTKEAIVA